MAEFGNRFLNMVLWGCITNTDFLRQIRTSFPLELYKSSVRQNVAQLLYYIDQYKEAPGDHFYDLFYDFIEEVSDKKKTLYIKLNASLSSSYFIINFLISLIIKSYFFFANTACYKEK